MTITKGKAVMTPLGHGTLTGKKNMTRNGFDWLRAEVKLDKMPGSHNKKLLWFFRNELKEA